MFVGIWGRGFLPQKRFESQKTSIMDIIRDQGQTMEKGVHKYDGKSLAARMTTPCEGEYWKEMIKGSFSDIFFVTTLGKVPEFIVEMNSIVKKNDYDANEMGIYIQPQNCGTSVHLEFTLPYGTDKEKAVVEKIYREASVAMADMGAYYSRPYGIWSNLQLSKDSVSYDVLMRLKGIFDPDDVLNRGKLTLTDKPSSSDSEKGGM
ncbi:MAG: hypothetical protein HUJ76_12865 [Parasporobacterium sp.]|nr:hypothetical protein [Parasporobacterium sp.]